MITEPGPPPGVKESGITRQGITRARSGRPPASAAGMDAAQPGRGHMAREVAALLAACGYGVTFPPGRDPAVFKVTGLCGEPDVEVTAEETGVTGCMYVGRTVAAAAEVISRLRPVRADAPADDADVCIAAWNGIAVEWAFLPPEEQPAGPSHIVRRLLPHLASIDPRAERGPAPC